MVFFVARSDVAEALDLVEEALDQVAEAEELWIDRAVHLRSRWVGMCGRPP